MPFIYPTAFEMSEIQQDLIRRGMEGRIGMDIMPMVEKRVPKIRWKQKDNYYGLQAFRGLDGAPTRVVRVGHKIYEYEPGIFGEFTELTETELTIRAAGFPVETTPIDISDLYMEADELLIGRELDRVESSIWTLLTTGVLNIIMDGPDGTQVGYNDAYTFQSYSALVGWTSFSSAVPIQDFQAVQQLGIAAGHSVDFGAAAKAYATQATWNLLLNNANTADFAGKRNQYGATLNNLPAMANYLQGQNLPQPVVYDQGYIPRQGSSPGTQAFGGGKFKKFIPYRTIVVIGVRPQNARVGEYISTINASNNFNPGSYRYTLDRANGGGMGGGNAEKRTPANIEIHRGHNGGPVIYYPTAVVVMSV
jgi:hypothetical protein